MSEGKGAMDRSAPVVVTREGAVGIIELARPEKYNCLSTAVAKTIEAALNAFEQPESGVHAILLRSQGKCFSTGADLEEIKAVRSDPANLKRFLAYGHHVLRRIEASDLPVVAACHGLTLAGGIELMLACDVIFAAKDARFGDQHARFGFMPGWGGTQRVPRVIGIRRGLELMLTGRWIDADTAFEWGLVNYVVEPDKLHAVALEYCQDFAKRSRVGIATMKRLARQGLEGSLDAGLKLELELATVALLNPDVSEGLAAFEGKRAPTFN